MPEGALGKFSADFLTERLRAGGALARGRVLAVDVGEPPDTLISTAAPLRLRYSSDAPADAPARLFLKATRDGLDPGLRSVYPRDGASAAGIRLIDWDAWRIGRAAADLAHMMAVHWYPERRARLEARLLERHHAGLRAHGVADYRLESL